MSNHSTLSIHASAQRASVQLAMAVLLALTTVPGANAQLAQSDQAQGVITFSGAIVAGEFSRSVSRAEARSSSSINRSKARAEANDVIEISYAAPLGEKQSALLSIEESGRGTDGAAITSQVPVTASYRSSAGDLTPSNARYPFRLNGSGGTLALSSPLAKATARAHRLIVVTAYD